MSEHLDAVKQDIVEAVLASPKAQAVVASATTGIAIDHNIMSWLPQYVSIVGGALGLVLTTMMIFHKWIQIKKDLKG